MCRCGRGVLPITAHLSGGLVVASQPIFVMCKCLPPLAASMLANTKPIYQQRIMSGESQRGILTILRFSRVPTVGANKVCGELPVLELCSVEVVLSVVEQCHLVRVVIHPPTACKFLTEQFNWFSSQITGTLTVRELGIRED